MQLRYFLMAGVAELLLVGGFASPVMAQETTSIIRGTVTKDGLPVAGATITATNIPSGTRSSTTTGSNGEFTFPGLRVGGPYTVEVKSAKGSTSVTDVYTVVQQTYNLPIELAKDSTSDIIVTAAKVRGAGAVSKGVQTTLTATDISVVASVNRDIRDIERRDPFATFDIGNSTDRGGAVRFAGVNPRFNRFTINGVTVGDNFGLNQDASPTNRGLCRSMRLLKFQRRRQISTSAKLIIRAASLMRSYCPVQIS